MKKVFSKAKRVFAIALAVISTFGVAQKADLLPATTVKAISEIEVETAEKINPGDSTGWRNATNKSEYGEVKFAYFKVTLPYDGVFSCTITSKDSNRLGFKCYTDDLSHCVLSDFSYPNRAPETLSRSVIVSAGTYIIETEIEQGHQFNLRTGFKSYDVKETEDNFEAPKTYNLGDTVVDTITENDRVDWYKVNIPVAGKYDYTFTSNSMILYFTINNENATSCYAREIAFADSEPKTTQSNVFLKPGNYLIKVYPSYASGGTKYSFKISPSKEDVPKLTKAKSRNKKTAEITVKKISDISGYQVQYSTDKKFTKGTKTKTVSVSKLSGSGSNYKITLKKLKRKKLYYFKVRSYIEKDGIKFYSDWSKVKKVKIK